MQIRALGANAFFALLFAFMPMVPQVALAETVAVEERLGVPGPISFDGVDYRLAWSAQPKADYYKQEYLPDGQNVERYEAMLLIELATGDDVTLKSVVGAQVRMLTERKKSDPVTNFVLIAQPGSDDVVLDFVVQGKDSDGAPITEWNAYRYRPFVKGERSGVALFAISKRAYGDTAGLAFLGTLKDTRQTALRALETGTFPALEPR